MLTRLENFNRDLIVAGLSQTDRLRWLLWRLTASKLHMVLPLRLTARFGNPLIPSCHIRVPTTATDLLSDVQIYQQVCSDYFKHTCFLPRPNDVVIDVGANIGLYSVIATQCGAIVHAFEPLGWAFSRLRTISAANAAAFSSTQAAVGNGDRRRMYTLYRGRQATLDPNWCAPHTRTDALERGSTEVNTLRLADYLSKQRLECVSLLKIDVEGAEVDVLRGAAPVLPRVRGLVVEWHSDGLREEVRSLVAQAGMTLLDGSDTRQVVGIDYFVGRCCS